MSERYPLKIKRELIKVLDVYRTLDPLQRFSTTSKFLNSIIISKVNEVLDYLKEEYEKKNPELLKILDQKEYLVVKKAIEMGLKF